MITLDVIYAIIILSLHGEVLRGKGLIFILWMIVFNVYIVIRNYVTKEQAD